MYEHAVNLDHGSFSQNLSIFFLWFWQGRGGSGCNDDAVVVYVLIVFKIFIIEVLTTLLQTSN